MGEVYRARDTRLGRDVAIKTLPESLATDPERLARFRREAETLAALNHPNIATIFGLEQLDGVLALAMELVEGPTLADRIGRGPLPLEEALPIAKQLATALEAAHDKGIIHRDLKPANVKLTTDGSVKLLDFGLAKALDGSGGSGGPSGPGGFTASPTMSVMATQAGVLLGTAAYMSPEQVRGAAVDKRADIWAFGVVLYEMLAGRGLFGGDTISDTLAGVLREPIDLEKLPASTPNTIRRLFARCLERDPKRRLRDIGEARIAIDEYLADPSSDALPLRSHAPVRPRWQRALPWALVAVLAGSVGAATVRLLRSASPASEPTSTFDIDLKGLSLQRGGPAGGYVAMTRDGRRIVVAAAPRADTAGGGSHVRQRLYQRSLDRVEFTPIAGTEDSYAPFVSPDGQWVAFASAVN
jgi:serine/threonine protein kinase